MKPFPPPTEPDDWLPKPPAFSAADEAQEESLVRHWPQWIMLGLLLWGVMLAVGAYFFGGNYPLLRAAIIFGCTVVFIAFWAVMLAWRNYRQSDEG